MKKILNCIFLVITFGFSTSGFSSPIELIKLKPANFSALPGWNQVSGLNQSFNSFQSSCKVVLKLKPNQSLGSNYFNLKAKDLYPACKAAQALKSPSTKTLKRFFTKWFKPAIFTQKEPVSGKFTAYYMPTIKGSLTRTSKYSVPIYGVPSDLVRHQGKVKRRVKNGFVPYYTRREINNGAIKNKAPVLAWIENPIDRVMLGVEGTGIIQLPNKKEICLHYAITNGRPSTLLPALLEKLGIMSKREATKERMKAYFSKNPSKLTPTLNQGESFTFYTRTNQKRGFGAFHTMLTPGYSLAVDPSWVPFGIPLWVNTTKLDYLTKRSRNIQRLMIAQDTGSAIKGPVRGDIFAGTGKEADFLGNHMVSPGKYWLLIPKNLLARLEKKS